MEYVEKSMIKAGAELMAEKDKYISELIDVLHMWGIHHLGCPACSFVTDNVLKRRPPFALMAAESTSAKD